MEFGKETGRYLQWNLERKTGCFLDSLRSRYSTRRLGRWPADPRAPCGATTAGHPVFKTFVQFCLRIWSLAVYIARFRSQLRAHVFSMFSPCCRIFWRSLEISFDRTMKAVSVLKFLAGTRIEHSKTCPRAPPGRSRIWQKAARRQPKAALEPSFDASKRDPKREPEKIRFRTRKQKRHR